MQCLPTMSVALVLAELETGLIWASPHPGLGCRQGRDCSIRGRNKGLLNLAFSHPVSQVIGVENLGALAPASFEGIQVSGAHKALMRVPNGL